MNPQTGKFMVALGLILVVLGLLIWFLGSKLHWIGKLPGDLRWEKGNTKIYFPIVTMLVVSLLLNLLIAVIRKFF